MTHAASVRGLEKIKKTIENDSCGHLVFQNEAKIYDITTLVGINLLCKFGKFMLMNNGGMPL